MTKFEKYPLFKYDEPVKYEDFKGGINTDPANENLAPNELRDGLNLHFSNVTLRNRLGARQISAIYSEIPLIKVQGIFFYTNIQTYIIVAADGMLFYSDFSVGQEEVTVQRLHIRPIYGSDAYEIHRPINQSLGLDVYNVELNGIEHDGYLYYPPNGEEEIIFQNKYDIEAGSYENRLYIATGTRFIQVQKEDDDTLIAVPVFPYKPTSSEMKMIGMNLLSPYPIYCQNESFYDDVKTSIGSVLATYFATRDGNRFYRVRAIMSYAAGESEKDYFFKWEEIDQYGNASPVIDFNNETYMYIFNCVPGPTGMPLSQGKDFIEVPESRLKQGFKYRCTFANKFEVDVMTNTRKIEVISYGQEQTYQDYIMDVALGWFGSATSIEPLYADQEPNDIWKQIQTCKKMLMDGNKIVLYDDAFDSGNWFKTVIDHPAYILQRNSLNFRTGKNEKIIKAVHFKGLIVVFSNNPKLGGNIALVTGNGDDYAGNEYEYSPYKRAVVNVNVSCDNDKTIQVAENNLIFKYGKNIFQLSASELNLEIVNLQTLNDKLRLRNEYVNIPWEDNECVSEITDNYYGLIWPEKLTVEHGEVFVEREAMRLKMYYKLATQGEDKIYYPWLRDESKTFNVRKIIYMDGIATHLYDNRLIQYSGDNFNDLGNRYTSKYVFRSYDLNYPGIVKFIHGVIVYYYRGRTSSSVFTLKVNNEAGYPLMEQTESEAKVFQTGDNIGSTPGQLDLENVSVKIFHAPYKFPCLLADTNIIINNDGDFSLGSVTYLFTTAELPDTSMTPDYRKIIRKGVRTPLTREALLNKELVNVFENPDEAVIIGGSASDFEGGD